MNIFLDAYLNNNLGDDLMIDYLCKRYPKHIFYICNNNNVKSVSIKNKNLIIMDAITPYNYQKIRRLINRIIAFWRIPKIQLIKHFRRRPYDAHIELGGSIFMQITPKSWINKVRDSKYILGNTHLNLIVNCNFGPYSDARFRDEHELLFKKFNKVVFRDKYSYSLFKTLDNCLCFPDLVFNMKFDHNPNTNIVGISVISTDNVGIKDYKEMYIKNLITLIDSLKINSHVVLLSFCEAEGDLITCNKIIKRGRYEHHEVEIFNHENLYSTLGMIKQMSSMVCTRFHANVIAIKMGIPFLPVIYSEKTESMLNDFDYKGYKWNIKNGTSLDYELAKEQLSHIPSINYEYMEEAEGHLNVLDTFLA